MSGCGRGRLREADRYLAEGRYPAAARAYGDVLEAHPRAERALLGQARALLAAEQFEEALRAAQAAADRALPEGVVLQAAALLELGRAAEAEALLRGADLALIPGGQRLLAEVLLSRQDIPGALAAARTAPDATSLLAWVALRAGEDAQARAAATTLLEVPPDAVADQVEAAGVLLALGVDARVEVDEETVQVWVREAARREAVGDGEGTLRALSRAAVARPEQAVYAEHLGLRWLGVGRPALARRALEDALSQEPQREKSWRGLVQACQQLQLPACEATAWEGLLKHFGDSTAAWEGAHAAWLAAGDLPRAQALWAEVVRRHPDEPLANLRYAQVLQRGGELDLAVGYARRAAALWPTNLDATLLLGELYLHRGDLLAAQAEFQRGLRAHPDDPRLRAGLQRALGYGPP